MQQTSNSHNRNRQLSQSGDSAQNPWEGPVGSDPIRQHGVQGQVLAITPYVQRQYT